MLYRAKRPNDQSIYNLDKYFVSNSRDVTREIILLLTSDSALWHLYANATFM